MTYFPKNYEVLYLSLEGSLFPCLFGSFEQMPKHLCPKPLYEQTLPLPQEGKRQHLGGLETVFRHAVGHFVGGREKTDCCYLCDLGE